MRSDADDECRIKLGSTVSNYDIQTAIKRLFLNKTKNDPVFIRQVKREQVERKHTKLSVGR